MAQVARKLLVVGGSGFLGQSVCKAAVYKGWQTISLSRRGEPDQFARQGTPSWAKEVQWAKGDSTTPATYNELLTGVTDIVHTVGIILESDYKQVVNDPTVFGALCGASKVLGEIAGMTDRGNPLDPRKQTAHTYESINRDAAIQVAKQAAKQESVQSFSYISASDVFPLINPRYITSKREAERFLLGEPSFKAIILRPGFMYSDARPVSLPLATALQTANAVTRPIAKDIASLPFGKTFTTPPLHIDTVAMAVIQGIQNGEQHIYEVDGIKQLASQFE
ncbi:hypothetical protein BC940DRAFT_292898 [Gongronella butleri]|nr:hypothetical protein BC940DRAFT_292898 [Gongronella butleri]